MQLVYSLHACAHQVHTPYPKLTDPDVNFFPVLSKYDSNTMQKSFVIYTRHVQSSELIVD